jgi:hypothetical protein
MHFQGPQPQEVLLVIPDKVLLLNILLLLILEVAVEVGEPPRTTPETAPSEGGVELIALPTFSMNMPFAGLLARSIKTLETRNHTMFEGTEGRLALLHVGMRTYPDGGKHRDILRRGAPGEGKAGLNDAQIDRLVQTIATVLDEHILAGHADIGSTVLHIRGYIAGPDRKSGG